jgi:hypothetical protein
MKTWEIDYGGSAPKLLAAVAQFLPQASTVIFEIRNACPEAQQIYSHHQSPVRFQTHRDTAYPKTQLHYCKISQALADELEIVLRGHKRDEVFWHIKGFDDRMMLFSIHDAGLGDPAYFSGRIEPEIVSHIATALGQRAVETDTFYDWNKNQT